MKKRVLAVILALALALTLLPAWALAAEETGETITVSVTVSQYGAILTGKDGQSLAEVPITLSGQENTLDDVFRALHAAYYDGEDGYASEEGSYGLSVKTFWGDSSGYVGYQLNGGAVSVTGLAQSVADGDDVDAYLTQSAYPDTEAYTVFDAYTAQVTAGEDLTLTLREAGYDENWNTVFTPCAGAALTVDGGELDPAVTTDETGAASLTFDRAGTYVVSAAKTKEVGDQTVTAITAPVCVVTVSPKTEEAPPETDDTAAGALSALHRIAETYVQSDLAADQNAPWLAADLAAYAAAFPDTEHTLSGEQTQALLDALIPAAESATKPGDLAKYTLALRALGYDPRRLTTASGQEFDLIAKLTDLVDREEDSVTNVYTLPYVLLALQSGEDFATAAQLDFLVDSAVASQESWRDTQWGPDGATPMLLALAPYYETDPAVKTAVDDALTAVKATQTADGSLAGNAASTGLGMAAYAALGQDPAEVKSDEDKSPLDGLMAYLSQTGDGFLYAGEPSGFATEQGFRGLVAWARYENAQAAVRVYDFADTPMEPAAATPDSSSSSGGGSSSGSSSSGGSGSSTVGSTITVTFTLLGDDPHGPGGEVHTLAGNNLTLWLEETVVTVSKGSTALDVIQKALDRAGLDYEIQDSGYIVSVKGLSELDNGKNSGWKYTLNGEAPKVSASAQMVRSGDKLLLHYTDDYTLESDAIGSVTRPSSSGSSSAATETPEEPDPASEEPKTAILFTDIDDGHWAKASIDFVSRRGLLLGTGDGAFSPEQPLSRAMLATVLYRLEDGKAQGENPFADVEQGQWYTDAAIWAADTGVVVGDGAGFAPDRDVTRQELAVMLWRYAKSVNADCSATDRLNTFPDCGEVSDWAWEAMVWAVDSGLVTGRGDGALAPTARASRAEAAALMERLVGWLAQEGIDK